MKCANCNADLTEGTDFCASCGHKTEAAPAQNVCSACGAVMAPGEIFCGNCGAKNEVAAETPKAKKPAAKKTAKIKKIHISKEKLKLSPTVIKIAGIAAAVVVLILLISLFSGKGDNAVLYLKDDQLHYLQLPNGKEPLEVTKKLIDNEDYYGNTYYYLYTCAEFSADGKLLFYPDKINGDQYTLYCRDVTNSKKEPVKIDSDLDGQAYLNRETKVVYYVKDDKLYQHDTKEKTKIASDVLSFSLSEDGKTLMYTSGDSGDYKLYLKKGNKDAEKVASGISYVAYRSPDLSTILYMKEDTLYLLKNGKDPQKVASDVKEVWKSYESGACYYTKQDDAELNMWSLFDDDTDGTESAYLKASFEQQYIDNPISELYYFDGKNSTLVTKNALGFTASAKDADIVAFTALTEEDLPQIRLSKYMESYGYIDEMFAELLSEESSFFLAQGAKSEALKMDDMDSLSISSDGKTLQIWTDYDREDNTYTIHTGKLSGISLKSTKKIDKDVVLSRFLSNNEIVYWKDIDENNNGEMYLNGEKISDEASVDFFNYDEDSGNLYFMEDYKANKNEGNLVFWNGKKTVPIQDDTYTFYLVNSKTILLLHDYSTKKEEGDLSIWNGRKVTKLDEDVRSVILVYDQE